MKHLFYAVADVGFFPGAVSLISSVIRFHPDAHFVIGIAPPDKKMMTDTQKSHLRSLPNVTLLKPKEYADKWGIQHPYGCKAALAHYAMQKALQEGFDTCTCCDADLFLVHGLDKFLKQAVESQLPQGYNDGSRPYEKTVEEDSELYPYFEFCGVKRRPTVTYGFVYSGLLIFPVSAKYGHVCELWAKSMTKPNKHLSRKRGAGDQDRICAILAVLGHVPQVPDKGTDIIIGTSPWKDRKFKRVDDVYSIKNRVIYSIHKGHSGPRIWHMDLEYVKKYRNKGGTLDLVYDQFLQDLFDAPRGLTVTIPEHKIRGKLKNLLPKCPQLLDHHTQRVKKLPVSGKAVPIHLPYRGEFGHKVMWHAPRIHAEKSPKVVCCEIGEEALYPSADEYIFVERKEDAKRRELERYDIKFRIAVQEDIRKARAGQAISFVHPDRRGPTKRFVPAPHIVQDISCDIAVCPRKRGFGHAKNWKHWADLTRALTKNGHSVFACGAPDSSTDVPCPKAWEYERFLDATLEAFASADLVVATDAGLMHLAVMCGKPVAVICAPGERTNPNGPAIRKNRINKANHMKQPIRYMPYWKDVKSLVKAINKFRAEVSK
jgi:hypothetical protein